jgi:hypothetical protein
VTHDVAPPASPAPTAVVLTPTLPPQLPTPVPSRAPPPPPTSGASARSASAPPTVGRSGRGALARATPPSPPHGLTDVGQWTPSRTGRAPSPMASGPSRGPSLILTSSQRQGSPHATTGQQDVDGRIKGQVPAGRPSTPTAPIVGDPVGGSVDRLVQDLASVQTLQVHGSA